MVTSAKGKTKMEEEGSREGRWRRWTLWNRSRRATWDLEEGSAGIGGRILICTRLLVLVPEYFTIGGPYLFLFGTGCVIDKITGRK